MNNTDKKKFAELMFTLTAIYDMDFSNSIKTNIWFETLSEFSIEEIEKAIRRYTKSPDSGGFNPKPSDLIKIIEGTSDDKAFLAWSKLIEGVKRIGIYQTVVFDDPLIHRVVQDMGGWCEFGRKEEKELPFVSKEFCQRYRFYSSKGIIPDHCKRLLGLSEGDCLAKGHEKHIPDPVFIGDKEKALLIYRGEKQTQIAA